MESNDLYRELWNQDLSNTAKQDILQEVGCGPTYSSIQWDELPFGIWSQLTAEFAEFTEIRSPKERIK